MPIVAVAAAAVSWIGAGAAVGAAIGGTLTVMGALEIVGAVGATLGAIGMITKDKGLMTAGLVMGGIGGIGALAVSAGVFGASAGSAAIFGTSAASTASAASTGAAAAAPGAEAAFGMGGALEGIPGSAAGVGALGAAAPDIIDTATMIESQMPGLAATAPSAASIGAPTVADLTGAVNPAAPNIIPPASTPADLTGSALGPGGLPATSPGSATLNPSGGLLSAPKTWTPGAEGFPVTTAQPGIFSKLMSNPYAQYGLIQSAGGLIQGMFDPLKPAQVAALDAQAAANRAATTLSLKQQANIAAPIPNASRLRPPEVTGTPAASGLINSPANVVTGIAA